MIGEGFFAQRSGAAQMNTRNLYYEVKFKISFIEYVEQKGKKTPGKCKEQEEGPKSGKHKKEGK